MERTRARAPAPHYLHLVSRLSQHHRHFHLFLSSEDGYFYGVAGAVFVHDLGQVLLALDFFSVDGDDQISSDHDGNVAEVGAFGAAAQSGAVGGASGNGLHDEQSVVGGQAQFLGDFSIDGNGANAERGTAHASERDQIVDHGFGGVDRDGEADAGALSDAWRRSSC